MKIFLYLLIPVSFLIYGCASEPSKTEAMNDQPLIEIPVHESSNKDNTADSGFEDISLSSRKRLQLLTNKMEIEKETENYIDHGQAGIITRPDGTIVYPYGLAPINLIARKMMYSKIVLQEGEKIVSAAAGDTTRWSILPSYIGNAHFYTPVVLIKPFLGGLQTSLSIITDKRDYDITIQSVDKGDYMSRIGFYYPQDKADSIHVGLPPDKMENNETRQPKINMEHIQYNYKITGNKNLTWFPVSVFDDRNKVFIKMPEKVDRSQLPVFMTMDRKGQPEVVNYRYFKPYYVIDTLFDKGILILGTDRYKETIKIVKV
ncbi:MAG: TrbG/VirB9 family P-type conjugative transfer protein [Candidatus Omnitrophica bacterium]|nr:TrbG/VirB9 family P-type conjugative transfer protein [Candidatus Omnitrophota bacterium]